MLGGDALGVELHAMHGQGLVLQAHDQAVGLRRDLEAVAAGSRARRSASDSASPRSPAAGPRTRPCRCGGSGWSCRASAAGARTTLPPKAWPMAWWPRQTPRIGDGRARPSRSVQGRCPASFGVQGPGESTIASGLAEITWPTLILSLRCTTVSAPSSPRKWTEVVGEAVVVIDEEDHCALPARAGEAHGFLGGAEQGLGLVHAFLLLALGHRCRRRCRRPPAHTSCRP